MEKKEVARQLIYINMQLSNLLVELDNQTADMLTVATDTIHDIVKRLAKELKQE